MEPIDGESVEVGAAVQASRGRLMLVNVRHRASTESGSFWSAVSEIAGSVNGWRRRHPLRTASLLVALGLGVFVWGVFIWPADVTQTANESIGPGGAAAAAQDRAVATDNASKRTVVLALLGGLIASGGLWVSVSNHRRQTAHDAHIHEKDRLDGVHQRYATAVEHLASKNVAVQAAAVYALEDVIRDDPGRRVAIVQMLVAFAAVVRREIEAETADGLDPRPDARSIAAQVVVARRKHDLAAPSAWLLGADLQGYGLSGADFSAPHNFRGQLGRFSAHLRKRTDPKDPGNPNFMDANLRAADLSGADLTGVLMFGADALGANMEGASLEGSHLMTAELMFANLRDARLADADLREVVLTGATLCGADLRGACMARAKLAHADLSGADLSGVDFEAADFGNAVLHDVKSWEGANVFGVRGQPDDWCPDGAVRMPMEDWHRWKGEQS